MVGGGGFGVSSALSPGALGYDWVLGDLFFFWGLGDDSDFSGQGAAETVYGC